MNTKIIKSVHHTPIYLPAFLMLVLSSCYTQVDISSFEKSKSTSNPFQNEVPDYNIIGTWQKKIPWMDGPMQVQQLIFDANHNLLFEEYLGLFHGDKLSGSFKTKDSILTIKLDYGYGTENYYYQVADGTLTLVPIDMDRHFPYKISGSAGTMWTNPSFDKSRP